MRLWQQFQDGRAGEAFPRLTDETSVERFPLRRGAMKILLIKLGALGDVLRTTPILEGLKKKYPECHVTWLVDPKNRPALENNARIDRLESLEEGGQGWRKARYDVVINLDKEPEALEALEGTKAALKMGFGGVGGKVCPVNDLSEYAYRLGVDDEGATVGVEESTQ